MGWRIPLVPLTKRRLPRTLSAPASAARRAWGFQNVLAAAFAGSNAPRLRPSWSRSGRTSPMALGPSNVAKLFFAAQNNNIDSEMNAGTQHRFNYQKQRACASVIACAKAAAFPKSRRQEEVMQICRH